MACLNPIDHYKLPVGKLRKGDPADFICVNNLKEFKVLKTFIDGTQVAEKGRTRISRVVPEVVNHFNARACESKDFAVPALGKRIRVIEALDGQLITNELVMEPKIENGFAVADVTRDLLKIVVVNRYSSGIPASAFIKNFNLKEGAIASSVAHDSHNIICVGVDDVSIARAVNLIVKHKGGVSAVMATSELAIALPVAGIMSDEDGYIVAQRYKAIDTLAKTMGSNLKAPFMTLSFMALLVIPSLKLSDRGLFNGDQFEFTEVFLKSKNPTG
jgi:adenine deaminase